MSLEDLPEDDEEAFLELEGRYRAECMEVSRDWNSNEPPLDVCLRYIGRVLAARTSLEIDGLKGWQLPSYGDFNSTVFYDFLGEVEHLRTSLEIAIARRTRGLSVPLNQAAKERIRHHLRLIREIVEELDVEEGMKERLLSKISKLDRELDRTRSRLAAYGDLAVDIAGIVGRAAEKAEPLRKWLETIGYVIHGERVKDEQKKLPRPEERKRIEPPKKPKGDFGKGDLDDDIPF